MRIALVVNPASGPGLDPERLAGCLRAHGAAVELFARGDCVRAAASGADRLVMAGGDGSIGPAAAAAGAAGVPLAVVAAGTANNFTRALGLPSRFADACRLAATGTQIRDVELGRIDGRPFVNAASAGLAVPAARAAAAWKRRLGPAAYVLGALRAGLTGRPLRCRIVVDGSELFAGEAWQLTVGCTAAFGAGVRIETADPFDGRLEIAVLAARNRARLIGFGRALRAGRVSEREDVIISRGERVEVELAGEPGWNVDGELIGRGSAGFTVEPAAFSVVSGSSGDREARL